MSILEIIEKKKQKEILTAKEYGYLITNYLNDQVKDYQISALLMAICLNGCVDQEVFDLTEAMLNSGEKIKIHSKNKNKLIIDKHSSGGVGDKVTLILSPILACLGYDVAKISGRGLSFTGGTIDKLESVCAQTNIADYQNLINKFHFFNAMQSENIVPADKKLYALRDVTGTVNSTALIASSIMSKKLAVNSDYIFLDIKVGDGAFCKTQRQAVQLSKLMLKIAKYFKREVIIHLTSMQQPIGKAIGNKIEILESLNFLENYKKGSEDLKILIQDFVIDILLDTKVAPSKSSAMKMYKEILLSQEPYKLMVDYLTHQGADKKILVEKTFFDPKHKLIIKAKKSGYINYFSSKEIGLISVELGAGRKIKTDTLDFDAGIYLNYKKNDYVTVGETIATLYSSNPISQELEKRFLNNLEYSEKLFETEKMILKKIK